MNAGDEPGDFTGSPITTTVAGFISIASAEGISFTGDFHRDEIVGSDAEEFGCAVSTAMKMKMASSMNFGGEDRGTTASALDLTEVRDEIDNDRDGAIDEGTTTSTILMKMGSRGSSTAGAIEACDLPLGFVLNDNDCDDEDPAAYLDAPEICDGADNDCVLKWMKVSRLPFIETPIWMDTAISTMCCTLEAPETEGDSRWSNCR